MGTMKAQGKCRKCKENVGTVYGLYEIEESMEKVMSPENAATEFKKYRDFSTNRI